jgi:branched-chain amino acid transport system ATP-binding protein
MSSKLIWERENQDNKALLDVKGIRVHYERVEALKGVSLLLQHGEIVVLIGANGTGKSTLLKTISGLKRLTSGEIWYKGERIDSCPPHDIVAKGIAHVPEGRRIFPAMLVIENLEMGAYLRKDRDGIKGDLEEIFSHFHILKERRNQVAASLSGGEQQMLAFGRALMSKPHLMLMDEPSLGLSPIMVEEVGKIITDINHKGISILLVEQNAHMALELANRAFVLQTGTIVLEGNSRDLMQNEEVQKAYLGL